ncbi:ComEA family DNA-binding protein [Gorillibacterium massiliense]|uniref:ComEA family DNA-binding protein n=1 Tax=Gorillibacterium massiliense TaxID=1280390 RepID=UPI0004B1D638|nr:helix-hairpin-helix domain-containing protein [Gorillibacterium massiliense]
MGMYWLQYRNRIITVLIIIAAACGGYGFARVTDGHAASGALPTANREMAQMLADLKPAADATTNAAGGKGSAGQTDMSTAISSASSVSGTAPDQPASASAAGAAPVAASASAGPSANKTSASADGAARPDSANDAPVSATSAESAQVQEINQSGKIDLNTASLQQLMELPRIGETKAKAIIAYREQHGGFKTASEIMNVKGIGEKTYENFRDQIVVSKLKN